MIDNDTAKITNKTTTIIKAKYINILYIHFLKSNKYNTIIRLFHYFYYLIIYYFYLIIFYSFILAAHTDANSIICQLLMSSSLFDKLDANDALNVSLTSSIVSKFIRPFINDNLTFSYDEHR